MTAVGPVTYASPVIQALLAFPKAAEDSLVGLDDQLLQVVVG